MKITQLIANKGKVLATILLLICCILQSFTINAYFEKKSMTPYFTKTNIHVNGLDPVFFKLSTANSHIKENQLMTITITASYLDISANLLFRFDNSNTFSLKVLMPKGFVQTGGNYSDFISGSVSKQQPYQTFTIIGYFEKVYSKNPSFLLLRSFNGANSSSYFTKKATLFLNSVPSAQQNLSQVAKSSTLFVDNDLLEYGPSQNHLINSFILKNYELKNQNNTKQNITYSTTGCSTGQVALTNNKALPHNSIHKDKACFEIRLKPGFNANAKNNIQYDAIISKN